MGYDINNNTHSERKNYNSTKNAKEVSRSISEYLGSKKYREAKEAQKKTEALLRQEEKGYTPQLIDLGKLSCFIEYFDMIRLEEQKLPQVGPFDNPSERESFKSGYEMGKILVRQGFSEENYHTFLENYEIKYQNNNPKLKP